MRNYQQHTQEKNCAIDLQTVDDFDFVTDFGMSVPFVLTRMLEWDGITPQQHPLVNITEDGNWRMMIFHVRDEHFYLAFTFDGNREAFILFIFKDHQESPTERHICKLWFEEYEVENPHRETFYLQVVYIEDVLSIEGYLPNTKYLVLPYTDMQRYFIITPNDDDPEHEEENGKYTITLPIQFEDVKMTST